jgi:glycosyl transferase family 87
MITRKRLTVWGTGLLGLSWFIYLHTLWTPGLIDRAGRFKGTDYIQFYVMGSMVVDGRTDALYDPAEHLQQGRSRIDSRLNLYAPHPNYGPQTALMFAPLALLPFAWSLASFIAITLAAYGVSIWLLWRECAGLRKYGTLTAILAAASPLLFGLLRYGQLSAFALLSWSAAFVALRRNRPFVAGLVLGLLAYKPTFGIVLALVLLTGRQWRIAAGAVASIAGQLAVALLMAGATSLAEYGHVLWTLMLDPRAVEIYPTEMHSLRGFFQLLTGSHQTVATLFLVSSVVAAVAAVRAWSSRAPLGLRWATLVLMTVLVSPHLITYDLVLLTVPLLMLAEWAVEHPNHPSRPGVSALLVLVYFAPFSGLLIARFTGVQLSVIVMALLAWRGYSICGNCSAINSSSGPNFFPQALPHPTGLIRP